MNTTNQEKEPFLISLYNTIPEYVSYQNSELAYALLSLRDLCLVSGTEENFKLELKKSVSVEAAVLKDFYGEAKLVPRPLKVFYDILFGPVDNLPLYINDEGYEIIANFRLTYL